ncbi:hypothetical protein [Endozoicomonas sp. SCSIO W0465]|uniref:hypothetical protein n=1 Tax=Endozoicomonas sp. SCSIO W0465 TaxID=2918516 RepID=UPI0020764A8E|nr:hypothetical protein [Endozoicomonas sp. SCSIO W0465]USE38832.1 hypothetical protein MJO57_12085 [Endozoicomonas sp. SCSIO W0465]
MLANIVEKWCLRGWYKNQKIPDLCGGAEQLQYLLSWSLNDCRSGSPCTDRTEYPSTFVIEGITKDGSITALGAWNPRTDYDSVRDVMGTAKRTCCTQFHPGSDPVCHTYSSG